MFPAKLTISYMNIFTFFDNLKETLVLGYWLPCQGHSPSPPPHWVPGQNGGGGGWHSSSYFFSLGWQDFNSLGLMWPAFSDFGTFWRLSQKGIIVGGKSWSKKYRENTSPGIQFFQNFLLKRFFSCQHKKKPGHIWPGPWKMGLKTNIPWSLNTVHSEIR
jgi:hypothetical protein